MIALILSLVAHTSQTSPALEWKAPSPIVASAEADLLATSSTNSLSLTITGSCPGRTVFRVEGGSPGDTCQILYAPSAGTFVIQDGRCGNITTGLDNTAKFLAQTFRFNSGAFVKFGTNLPAAACGYHVQAFEPFSCKISNVAVIQ